MSKKDEKEGGERVEKKKEDVGIRYNCQLQNGLQTNLCDSSTSHANV